MIRKTLFRLAATAAAFAVVAASFGGLVDSSMLDTAMQITSPHIATDLKLTPAQASEVGRIVAAFNSDYEELVKKMGATADQSDARQADMNKIAQLKTGAEEKLLALLTPSQKNRMRQLVIQAIGTEALSDDSISREVGLNAAQVAKIRAILDSEVKASDAYDTAVSDAIAKIPDPGSDDAALRAYAKKQEDVMKSMKPRHQQLLNMKAAGDKQIRALMNPTQLKKWLALPGKPLKTA
jgi:hypothetical protein